MTLPPAGQCRLSAPMFPLRLSAALTFVIGASVAFAASPPPDDNGWQALLERRFNEAGPAFDHALTTAPQDRTLIVGRAVALLSVQPRTRDNVAQADALLASLETGQDEAAFTARYLRARVAEVHLFDPDYALAAERYEALIAAAPNHPVAQAAVVKLVRLRVYYLATDPVKALSEAEEWGARMTEPSSRRDYHVAMARSLLFFGLDRARALVHLQAAARDGFVIALNQADTLVSIGELARELGDTKLARESFTRFLDKHPRDVRRHFVQTLIAALPADAAPQP